MTSWHRCLFEASNLVFKAEKYDPPRKDETERFLNGIISALPLKYFAKEQNEQANAKLHRIVAGCRSLAFFSSVLSLFPVLIRVAKPVADRPDYSAIQGLPNFFHLVCLLLRLKRQFHTAVLLPALGIVASIRPGTRRHLLLTLPIPWW